MWLCQRSVTPCCVIKGRSDGLKFCKFTRSVERNIRVFVVPRNVRHRRCPRVLSTSAALAASTVSWSIAGSTLYCLPLFLTVKTIYDFADSGLSLTSVIKSLHSCAQMICAPGWRVTRRVLSSDLVFLPLAATYCFLLSQSWEPDTLSLILPGSLREGITGTSTLHLSSPTAHCNGCQMDTPVSCRMHVFDAPSMTQSVSMPRWIQSSIFPKAGGDYEPIFSHCHSGFALGASAVHQFVCRSFSLLAR